MNFRLAGGFANYGRVEMSVDGVWGTICNRYWDKMDASVFCKSIGFATGFPYYKDSIKIQTGRIYEPNLHCNGDESSLLDCAHEGWKVAKSVDPCSSHEKDATVHCYNSGSFLFLLGKQGLNQIQIHCILIDYYIIFIKICFCFFYIFVVLLNILNSRLYAK
jgi:hypothetical protein